MKYRVILLPRAIRDLDNAYFWAARRAPSTAARWFNGFHAALRTLSTNPERCGLAPEAEPVRREIRQFLFGKRPGVWRALFTIEPQEVRVLHVRRAAMENASPDELTE
jgi:plasmid stabilization system protein ParE